MFTSHSTKLNCYVDDVCDPLPTKTALPAHCLRRGSKEVLSPSILVNTPVGVCDRAEWSFLYRDRSREDHSQPDLRGHVQSRHGAPSRAASCLFRLRDFVSDLPGLRCNNRRTPIPLHTAWARFIRRSAAMTDTSQREPTHSSCQPTLRIQPAGSTQPLIIATCYIGNTGPRINVFQAKTDLGCTRL